MQSVLTIIALSVLSLTAVGCSSSNTALKPKPSRPAPVPAFDVPVDSYVAASRGGSRVTVSGSAYQMGRTPDAPDDPLTSTTITLLPYSEGLRSTLESLKRRSRESADAYVATAPEMKKLREAYELALWHHGAADFILTATVKPDGTFRFDDVPPGHWLLYATHAKFARKEGRSRVGTDGRFPQARRFEGFYDVRVWLRDLDTSAAPPEKVELTDQNVWFSGVSEEWVTRPRPPLGAPR